MLSGQSYHLVFLSASRHNGPVLGFLHIKFSRRSVKGERANRVKNVIEWFTAEPDREKYIRITSNSNINVQSSYGKPGLMYDVEKRCELFQVISPLKFAKLWFHCHFQMDLLLKHGFFLAV